MSCLGLFYSYPSHCGRQTLQHRAMRPSSRSLPACPCPAKYLVLGRILRKPYDPTERKGMQSDFQQVSDEQKGQPLSHPLPLPHPGLSPLKMTSLNGKFSYLASTNGILIQECQHLYLFKERGKT